MAKPATEPAELEVAIAALVEQKRRWPLIPASVRIDLLERCVEGVVAVADDLAAAGCRAKGLDPDDAAGAEEWFSGPLPIIRNLRLLADTIKTLGPREDGARRDRFISRLRTSRWAGGVSVRVFPHDGFDRVMYPGVTIDVWLGTVSPALVQPDPTGAVTLVLGAGNVASIGVMDLLYKLFVEDQVVLLKMHPINDYVGPFVERAFAPLIAGGWLRVAYGGADVGQSLVVHPSVDTIHLTGSVAVHDRIAATTSKPITSELGCVTPVVVTPGRWTDSELRYQAENVATMVALNASCNCNAAKLLVTWRGWPQRAQLLDQVRAVLSKLPARRAYYPGSAEKYRRFVERHGGSAAIALGEATPSLPFATIFDLDPDSRNEEAFTEEAWSPVVAETSLPSGSEVEFLSDAASFCNDRVAGTLSAVVLADPRFRKQHASSFRHLVEALRYGTVAINHWSAVSYALAVASWGAYPGHTREAAGSGIGVVHNTLLLSGVVKSVLDAPFTTWPKPAWFVTNRRARDIARGMVRFEASPSWRRAAAVAWLALRP